MFCQLIFPHVMLTPLGVKLGSQVCGAPACLATENHAAEDGARRRCADCSQVWNTPPNIWNGKHAMHVCGTIRTPTACSVVKSRKTEIQACEEPSSPHAWLHNFTPNGVACGMKLEWREQMLSPWLIPQVFPNHYCLTIINPKRPQSSVLSDCSRGSL